MGESMRWREKGEGLESRVRVGVVTHQQREEKEDSPCLWPRTSGAWGLGSRERLGTTPRSQEAELGSWVLLPNPGEGQERPKRKDKEEETRWGGWGFHWAEATGLPGSHVKD